MLGSLAGCCTALLNTRLSSSGCKSRSLRRTASMLLHSYHRVQWLCTLDTCRSGPSLRYSCRHCTQQGPSFRTKLRTLLRRLRTLHWARDCCGTYVRCSTCLAQRDHRTSAAPDQRVCTMALSSRLNIYQAGRAHSTLPPAHQQRLAAAYGRNFGQA